MRRTDAMRNTPSFSHVTTKLEHSWETLALMEIGNTCVYGISRNHPEAQSMCYGRGTKDGCKFQGPREWDRWRNGDKSHTSMRHLLQIKHLRHLVTTEKKTKRKKNKEELCGKCLEVNAYERMSPQECRERTSSNYKWRIFDTNNQNLRTSRLLSIWHHPGRSYILNESDVLELNEGQTMGCWIWGMRVKNWDSGKNTAPRELFFNCPSTCKEITQQSPGKWWEWELIKLPDQNLSGI